MGITQNVRHLQVRILPHLQLFNQKNEIMKTETRELKCILSDEEINDRAKDMSQKNQERIDTEIEKKAVVKSFNQAIKNLQRIIDADARVINDGFEYREIECDIEMNTPVAGTKTITRNDTGKSWEEPMTDEEFNLFSDHNQLQPQEA